MLAAFYLTALCLPVPPRVQSGLALPTQTSLSTPLCIQQMLSKCLLLSSVADELGSGDVGSGDLQLGKLLKAS